MGAKASMRPRSAEHEEAHQRPWKAQCFPGDRWGEALITSSLMSQSTEIVSCYDRQGDVRERVGTRFIGKK
ncbi:hypothetical protein JNUCC1_02845 [Lentibacillus sp. JNUCC-1]|nr:hypothetical protein [Lentibacillus sp. JNUCC-1]